MKSKLLLLPTLLFLIFSCETEDSIVMNPQDDRVDVFVPKGSDCRVKRITSTNSSYTSYREFIYGRQGEIERINTETGNNYVRFGYNNEGRIDSIYSIPLQGHYFLIYWNGNRPSRTEIYLADTLYAIKKYTFDERELLSSIELIQSHNKQEYSRGFNYYFDDRENMIGWKIEDIFYLGYVFLRYDKMRNFRKLLGFDFLIRDIYSEAIQCFSSNNPLYTDDIDGQRKYMYQYNKRGYPVFVKEFGAETSMIIEYENCD